MEDEVVRVVAHLGFLTPCLVLLGVSLGLLHHSVNLVLAERRTTGDGHLLFLAGAEILRRDMHDAVRVDVEGDLHLRDATRCRRNANELERTEHLVAIRHVRLALEHLDLHRALIVVSSGEHLRPLGRDRGVALDELGHDLTLGLDTERQGGDIEKQDVFDLALQHAGLDSGADGNGFVGVDPLVAVLAREFVHEVRDCRHTRGSADEQDPVDATHRQTGVANGLFERSTTRFEQIARELLELRTRQGQLEVKRTVGGRRDERQIDRRFLQRGEFDLRLLGRFLQALGRHLVGTEVHTVRVLELGDHPVDHALVPVVTAEVSVAGGGLDLEDTFAEFQDRDVERAATEVEDEDGDVGVLLQPVRERGCGGLVDDAQDFETRDLAGLLRGLTLGVTEVRRHRDDRLSHRVTQVGLGIALELLQDACGDLLGVVRLAVDVDRPVGADVALHGTDGPVRVGDGLTLGDFAHEDFAGLGKRHDGRRGARTFGVRDDGRISGLQGRDNRVGGTEVDTDGLGH